MLVSAAKRSGAKAVLHFHCSVGDRVKGSLRTHTLKRMVKKADRALVLNSASADHIETVCGKKPVVKLVSRKPIVASEAELSENPRARSASLRIAEKL